MSSAVPWETINEKLPYARNKVGYFQIYLSDGIYKLYVYCTSQQVVVIDLCILQESYEKRKSMWAGIDVNGNGFASLAEITKVSPDIQLFKYLFPNNSK